jgi:hypothetical protein
MEDYPMIMMAEWFYYLGLCITGLLGFIIGVSLGRHLRQRSVDTITKEQMQQHYIRMTK